MVSTTDPNGNVTQYVYNVEGRQTEVVNALDGATTTTYDAVGNVLSVTDALGWTTSYVYDAMNRKVAEIEPLPQADGQLEGSLESASFVLPGIGWLYVAGGPITTWTYDDDGNVTEVTDPLLHHTWMQYNACNLPFAVTDALGTGPGSPSNATTTTTYDELGDVSSVTDPLGNTTQYVYDDLQRKIEEIDPAVYTSPDAGGALALTTPITYYGYDADGNLQYVTDPRGDVGIDNVHSSQAGAGDPYYTTWYFYDGLDRQTCVVDALACANDINETSDMTPASQPANSTFTTYDALGDVKTTTNANGNTTTYNYDYLGRKTSEVDPLVWATPDAGGAPEQIAPTAYYGYDADGNLKYVTDPRGDYNVDNSGEAGPERSQLHHVVLLRRPEPSGLRGRRPGQFEPVQRDVEPTARFPRQRHVRVLRRRRRRDFDHGPQQEHDLVHV